MNLQVQLVEEENRVQHVKIIGEIDVYTAPKLKEHLTAVEKGAGVQAELDLTDVAYMDSTGIGVFVGFYKAVHASGGHVKITGLNARLQRLFNITGLGSVMDIVTEEGEDKDATI